MDMEELSNSVSLSPIILTLIVLCLLCGFTPVKGESKVIGPSQPVVVAPGDDIILPCHVEPPVNVAQLTVEWSRPDLQPDPNDRLSRVEYVHLYRDTREVPDMKISSYMDRTALFADGLRQGNISLKIINVTLADAGRFKCFIPKLKSQTQYSIVYLVVEPKSAQTTETPLQPISLQTPDPTEDKDVKSGLSSRSRVILIVVFCILLAIIVVGVTGYLIHKYQKREHMKGPVV
ncbi:myelin-oligodendrocyte glycoprotein-like [Epinephelus fuscoguttatus]|uniref:myelin-oligodendrocyte glycoprotein-like n=1 Tax=Epinephelus fuscoguttatus TaxID=293821 RepID=UPI0020D090F4|nr:myelin-oligodendrocyte glycoprotein-like [Epinephelus fuscoguttatus]